MAQSYFHIEDAIGNLKSRLKATNEAIKTKTAESELLFITIMELENALDNQKKIDEQVNSDH